MTQFDEQLETLQMKIVRKNKVKSMLESSKENLETLKKEAEILRKKRDKELKDVEAVKGYSITSLVCSIAGNKEERMTKEEMEACAAELKYSGKLYQIDEVTNDISLMEREMETIAECERMYKLVVCDKLEFLKKKDPNNFFTICSLQETLARFKAEKKEIDEAVSAGVEVEKRAQKAIKELNTTKTLLITEKIKGFSLFEAMKDEHLESAQENIQCLQRELDTFVLEMSDVTIKINTPVDFSTFSKFTDIFFDKLCTQESMDVCVANAIDHLMDINEQMEKIMKLLFQLRSDLDKTIRFISLELKYFILSV